MTKFLRAVLTLCLAAPALAGTYYVSLKGTPDGDGSSASPWPSVDYAFSKVGGGHTIIVKAGMYQGPFFVPKSASGAANARTVLQAEVKWKVLVIGSATHGIYTADGTDYVTIDGFEVAGALDDGIKMNGNYGIVRNCWVHGSGGMGISGHTKNGWTIERNLVEFNGQNPQFHHGIYADGNGYTIRDNIVRHNSGYGIQVYPAASNGYIFNNLVYGQGRKSGMIVQSPKGGGHNVISNNTLADNAGGGLTLYNGDSEAIVNNIISNPGPAITLNSPVKDIWISYNLCQPACGSPEDNNITADPKFANPSRGAYYLTTGSPAIGNGRIEVAPAVDFWGRARAHDVNPDLGAFCYIPSLAPDSSRTSWYSGYGYRYSRNSGQDMPDLWKMPE